MRVFALYTLARACIFAVVFGLLWLVLYRQVEWTSLSAFATALVAMIISAIIAVPVLRGLREQLAAQVAARAQRTKSAFESRKQAEDSD